MFLRIWQEYHRVLRTIIRGVLPDGCQSEDVLQDAFTHLLQSGRVFKTEEEAYAYIRRVVMNTCIDYYRRSKRQSRFVDSSVYQPPRPELLNPLAVMLLREDERWQSRVLQEVHNAVQSLPSEQKQALEIAFWRGGEQKLKELCRENRIPYSTLRFRLNLALERIRRRLRARGLYPRKSPQRGRT